MSFTKGVFCEKKNQLYFLKKASNI